MLPLGQLGAAAASVGGEGGVGPSVKALLAALASGGRRAAAEGAGAAGGRESQNPWWRVERGRLVGSEGEALISEERQLLQRCLDTLRAAVPQLSEISLLSDALAQLDELFLVVVVGEFNSGKSSVINALLGDRYLAEGILPTTNEISVLKHSGDSKEATEQTVDGIFMRRGSCPAAVLAALAPSGRPDRCRPPSYAFSGATRCAGPTRTRSAGTCRLRC